MWYNQLYVDNPNSGLHFSDNLYERARAWYYFATGGTGAKFNLPQRTPNSLCYSWLPHMVRHSGLGAWAQHERYLYKADQGPVLGSEEFQSTCLKGMKEFLEAEIEAGQAEAAYLSRCGEEIAEESCPRHSQSTVVKRVQSQSTGVGSNQKRAHQEFEAKALSRGASRSETELEQSPTTGLMGARLPVAEVSPTLVSSSSSSVELDYSGDDRLE